MKTSFLFLQLLIAVNIFSQNNIDVLHYQFHIGLNDANDTLHGLAIIKFAVKEKKQLISFDLTGINKKGTGMQATITGLKNIYSGTEKYKHENDKLIIPTTLNKSDTGELIINYKGIPADGLIISKTKYGRRSFFADNWPDRGHNWLPCNEDPADKATVEFIVTAPGHYQVVANGTQVEETSIENNFKTTHWYESTPISTKVMVIGVAEFAVGLAGLVNDCIPVYSWVYPEDRDRGFYDYEIAKDILPFFINNVGPYGFKKLANVQSKTRFGGLENANTIFYSEGSVTGTRRSEGTVAHEIAHQWFGNMATEKSFGHLWLSEGFATYFTILYFENKYGKDTAIKMLQEDREQVTDYAKKSSKPVVDTAERNYMNLLNANSYQKGGWVLHMLRSELGDSVFWQVIKKYYAKYAGSIAGTDDLRKVAEEVTGEKFGQFFKQWLFTPGQPNLEISWNYLEADKHYYITIKQLQKEIFNFPISLLVNFANGQRKIYDIGVLEPVKDFKIKSDSRIVSIIPDPETKLLANFTVKEK
jgi:aminopeptidase N